MSTKDELQRRLAELRQEYKGVASMLSMMEKRTKLEDLVKMRREQLDPIKKEIQKVEEAVKNLV